MLKIAIILGTRPELIKMAPVIRQCESQNVDYFVIHTGQHYSFEMDEIIFNDLDLPLPKYRLSVGSGSHGQQTGKMMIEIEQILIQEKPTVTLVQGDTNSVLAGALTASKLHIAVGHIEAGLRSFDRKMPEEINRVITDHISDYLFTPTVNAEKYLLNEGIPKEKIFITGNTIVDSVTQSVDLAGKKSNILNDLKIKSKNYFLLTIHRAENTDHQETLEKLIIAIDTISKQHPSITIVWPLHPRTKAKLDEFNLYNKLNDNVNIKLIKPVGFLDFLQLESNAKLAITDSGGVQEEVCIIKVPCVTLRDNTERPETIDVKSNIIVGSNLNKIVDGVNYMLKKTNDWSNPFGDGTSSQQIIEILMRKS